MLRRAFEQFALDTRDSLSALWHGVKLGVTWGFRLLENHLDICTFELSVLVLLSIFALFCLGVWL